MCAHAVLVGVVERFGDLDADFEDFCWGELRVLGEQVGEGAAVCHLTAGLGVEGRLVEGDGGPVLVGAVGDDPGFEGGEQGVVVIEARRAHARRLSGGQGRGQGRCRASPASGRPPSSRP